MYKKKNELDEESVREFDHIKNELSKVEELYVAITKRIPISPHDQAYKEMVKIIFDARDKLLEIEETLAIQNGIELLDVKYQSSIKVVKCLEENKNFAKILNYGREIITEIIEQKSRNKEFGELELKDKYELIYWYFAKLISELKSFEDFDRSEGNKLLMLENYFCSKLKKKLKGGL